MARLTPQQLAFKKYYCSPKSETFSNAYQSALRAGFSEDYASVITTQKTEWFSEILADAHLLDLAEEALEEAVTYDVRNGGEKVDASVASIKAKSAQFIAERLGKERFATRQEHTGADGEPLAIPQEITTKINNVLDDYFAQRNSNERDSGGEASVV